MGTNYYLHSKPCETCGRGDAPKHIGKSSGGWCFSLHVDPDEGPRTLDDWRLLWAQPDMVIRDEYGVQMSTNDMMNIITQRKWPYSRRWTPQQYGENQAEPGPCGLVRSQVDGEHCIGHGDGTWDLIVGEFS